MGQTMVFSAATAGHDAIEGATASIRVGANALGIRTIVVIDVVKICGCRRVAGHELERVTYRQDRSGVRSTTSG
jgi:hypothetical protein